MSDSRWGPGGLKALRIAALPVPYGLRELGRDGDLYIRTPFQLSSISSPASLCMQEHKKHSHARRVLLYFVFPSPPRAPP